MLVTHLHPCPHFPPTYYTITTFPYHVATVQPKTAVIRVQVYLALQLSYVESVT